jgi:hypothetical protein
MLEGKFNRNTTAFQVQMQITCNVHKYEKECILHVYGANSDLTFRFGDRGGRHRLLGSAQIQADCQLGRLDRRHLRAIFVTGASTMLPLPTL